MSEVARRLRIGRPTPYRKLDSLGRDVSDPKNVCVVIRRHRQEKGCSLGCEPATPRQN